MLTHKEAIYLRAKVKQEAVDNRNSKQVDPKKRKTINSRLLKRLEFLNEVVLYLESSPREEYVLKEYDRVNDRLIWFNETIVAPIKARYDGGMEVRPLIQQAEKTYEIKKLRFQFENLKFILGK